MESLSLKTQTGVPRESSGDACRPSSLSPTALYHAGRRAQHKSCARSGKVASPNEKAPSWGVLTLAHAGDPTPVTWIDMNLYRHAQLSIHLLTFPRALKGTNQARLGEPYRADMQHPAIGPACILRRVSFAASADIQIVGACRLWFSAARLTSLA